MKRSTLSLCFFTLLCSVSFESLAKKKPDLWTCSFKSKETKLPLILDLKIQKNTILAKSKSGFYTLKNETEFLKIKEEKLNYKFHSWYANAQVIGDYKGDDFQKPSANNHRVFMIYLSKSEAGELEIYMHRLFYQENQIQTDDTKGICSLKSSL